MNKMLEDIKRISLLENKGLLERILKFNEEFGEFATEIGKLTGFTHKPYDEEHLIEEGADALVVQFSIIIKICEMQNIDFQRFIDAMERKNKIWESKIPNYIINKPVPPPTQLIRECNKPVPPFEVSPLTEEFKPIAGILIGKLYAKS